jgi:hypothetical protein
MSVQKGSIRLGIAKESAEGTAETAPAYVFGLESGGVNVAVAQEPDDLTSGQRTTSTVFRGNAETGAEFLGRANHASIGLIAYGALGGLATTGSTPTWTHTITLANALPAFTIFEGIVDGAGIDVPRIAGAKFDTLTFEWEGNNPLKVSGSLKGRALTFGASMTASITDETGLTTNYIPAGGTFKYDVDSATVAEACIKSGRITLTNNLTPDFCAGTVTAGGVSEGWHVAECAFTTTPADIDEWRTIITGTAGGTGIAASPVYGSFEFVFKTSANANHLLKLEGLKVAYMCDLPQAEAGGGAAEVELAGACLLPSGAGASPVKITVLNGTASY